MKRTRFFTRFLILIGIFSILSITTKIYANTELSGPKKNIMNCTNPITTGIKDGNLACYGIWDYADEFGNDSAMCPKDGYFEGKTGCQIKTKACSNGIATASKYYTPSGMDLNDTQLIDFATNLQSTPEIVQAQIPGLWIYTCGEKTTVREETGILSVFVDGTLIMTGIDITEKVALTQCKNKASSYQNSEIKCTWNNSQIYYIPASEKKSTYIVYLDGERYETKYDITQNDAASDCDRTHDLSPRSEIRCVWDGVEFYSDDADELVEYCGYGYEYFDDLDRCIKSTYLSYYPLMKREFGSIVSRLSVSKLKLVLDKIEDIEYRYSENTTTRLKLEALTLVIESEIREQQGDDFDFKDLFD